MTKKIYSVIFEFISISVFTVLIGYYYFGFNIVNLHMPLNYTTDGISSFAGIKFCLVNGDDMLGWPYHVGTYKYSPTYDMLYRMLVKVGGLLTSNYALILNGCVVVILYSNVVVTYYVLRCLDVKRYWAYPASIAFGFSVYVQWRIGVHLALAAIECIPIAFLLIIWLFEDDRFCTFKNGWYRYQKNYIGLLFSWIIANNGMVYYPFFTCFLLAVSFVIKWYNSKTVKKAYSFLIQIIEIVFWLAIDFIPSAIGELKGIGNSAVNGATRNAYRSTLYGLDIKALFLSPNGFGFDKLLSKYNYLLSADNENRFAYLGIVGIVGCLVLIFFATVGIKKTENIYQKRIMLFSRLIIAIFLLATSCGFGVLIALGVPFISCYNRINPYIAFLSIITFVYVVQVLEEKIRTKRKRIVLVFFVFSWFIFSIIEQRGIVGYANEDSQYAMKTYVVSEERVVDDQSFFERLEKKAGTSAMVYMLPYMKSFENGSTNDIADYDHLKAYLYTKTLKFSYGATNGSKNDEWYYLTSQLAPQDMCRELVEKGFSGIYINLNGYLESERNNVLQQLVAAANCDENELVFDVEGLRVYISLSQFGDE